MERIQNLLKLASSFSKYASWELYIVKWAASNTKLLGQLANYIQKINNPELKQKVIHLEKLYSDFVSVMNPNQQNPDYSKLSNTVETDINNVIREIMTSPHLDPKTGFKNDLYLAKNYLEFIDALTEVSMDVKDKVEEMASGQEEDVWQTPAEEYEEDERSEVEKFLSEEENGFKEQYKGIGKSEIGTGGYQVSGPSYVAKTEEERTFDTIKRKQKAKAIQEAKNKDISERSELDHKLIAQLNRQLESMKRFYITLKSDPVRYEAWLKNIAEMSLRSYHKKKERAASGEEEAKILMAKQAIRDKINSRLNKQINAILKQESKTNPIYKDWLDQEILRVKEKWDDNPEMQSQARNLKVQRKTFVEQIKNTNPKAIELTKKAKEEIDLAIAVLEHNFT